MPTFQSLYNFWVIPAIYVFQILHSSTKILLSVILLLALQVGVQWHHFVFLICILLMTGSVKDFMCLFPILISSWWNILYTLIPFVIELS